MKKCSVCGKETTRLLCDECIKKCYSLHVQSQQVSKLSKQTIISKALEAGFMITTLSGQDEPKQMPFSDTETLCKFVELVNAQSSERTHKEVSVEEIEHCINLFVKKISLEKGCFDLFRQEQLALAIHKLGMRKE